MAFISFTERLISALSLAAEAGAGLIWVDFNSVMSQEAPISWVLNSWAAQANHAHPSVQRFTRKKRKSMSLNGTFGVKSVEKYLIWQIFFDFTTPSSKSNDCRFVGGSHQLLVLRQRLWLEVLDLDKNQCERKVVWPWFAKAASDFDAGCMGVSCDFTKLI